MVKIILKRTFDLTLGLKKNYFIGFDSFVDLFNRYYLMWIIPTSFESLDKNNI